MNFNDIPQFPGADWQANVSWNYLGSWLEGHLYPVQGIAALDLDPDFQRAHVWTERQQTEYIEYVLMGGEVGRNLTFNCPGWGKDYRGPYVIIDGKQRLEAARKFMSNELTAFGKYFSEIEGRMRMAQGDFLWRVCSLETREEVLKLYLNINAGGTPHTEEELNRVRKLLDQERSSSASGGTG